MEQREGDETTKAEDAEAQRLREEETRKGLVHH